MEMRVVIAVLSVLLVSSDAMEIQKKQSRRCRKTGVLILGGGLAGIAAADTFWEKNMRNFLVLEAKARLGGRLMAGHIEGLSAPIEFGANWIHEAEKNVLVKILAKYNISGQVESTFTFKRSPTTYVDGNSTVTRFIDTLERWHESYEADHRGAKKKDLVLKKALRRHGWVAKTELEKAVEYLMIDYENAISSSQISGYMAAYTGEGGTDWLVTGGYWKPFQKIAKKFSQNVRLQHEVSMIERVDGAVYRYQITAKVANGEKVCFRAKQVLVTFSSGVLASQTVNFRPSLPSWKHAALRMLPMASYCKWFVLFPRTFWPPDRYPIMLQKNPQRFSFVMNLNDVFPGCNALLVTTTGRMCRQNQRDGKAKVLRGIMRALRSHYGSSIPNATSINSHFWDEDPHVMGAYSYPIVGISDEDFEKVARPVGNIFFAGEATTGEGYGFAHTAYQSGIDRATNMLKKP